MQITYSYPDDQTKPAASAKSPPPPGPALFPNTPIRQLTLTRAKTLWHALRVDIYGNSMGKWYDGREYFYEAAGISGPQANDAATDQFNLKVLPDFTRVDFPDMAWVSPQTYSGVETVETRRCMVFKKDDMTAWIDLESRFPVQWKRGGETRIFQQLPPPEGPLVLPPKIAAIAESLKRDRDKWNKLVRPVQ